MFFRQKNPSNHDLENFVCFFVLHRIKLNYPGSLRVDAKSRLSTRWSDDVVEVAGTRWNRSVWRCFGED